MDPKRQASGDPAILPMTGREVGFTASGEAEGLGCDVAGCEPPAYPIQIVLICGGRGTRLGRLNPEGRPKAMLPINGTPLVSHLWRRHRRLTSAPPIIVHAASDTSIPKFAESLAGGTILCPQVTPDGVANAFALAAPHLTGPALFLLGDVVLHGGFASPWPAPPAIGIWHEASAATVRANFGVRMEGNRITELVEKPTSTTGLICGIGAYVLRPDHLREFLHTPRNPRTNGAKSPKHCDTSCGGATNSARSASPARTSTSTNRRTWTTPPVSLHDLRIVLRFSTDTVSSWGLYTYHWSQFQRIGAPTATPRVYSSTADPLTLRRDPFINKVRSGAVSSVGRASD